MVKILFVIDNLRIGGIQKALVNLLIEISPIYDVSLYIFNPEGELMKEIPKNVTLVEAPKIFKILTVSQKQARVFGMKYYIVRMITATYTKLFSNRLPFYLLFKRQKKFVEYDVVISYMQSYSSKVLLGGCNEFVIERVKDAKKISFVHCDVRNYPGNTKLNNRMYSKFDLVAAVSDSCRNRLLEEIPTLREKACTICNCNDYAKILKQAKNQSVQYSNQFIIVTIARLSQEKGVIRSLQSVKHLVDRGYDFEWHIVGGGPLANDIQSEIHKLHLESLVFLEGEQKNPYRYLVNANLMLLPSYHEAAPMVFWEAACLGIPILTTNTVSAVEIVQLHDLGWVCENSVEGITGSLEELLSNTEVVIQKKMELSKKKYSNANAINQFNQAISRCLEGEGRWKLQELENQQ